MRAKIPRLGGSAFIPQFAPPSFLDTVAQDSAGVDSTLQSVDSLLSAAAAPMAVEDSLLGGFLSDLGTDTPAQSDFAAVDSSQLASDHANFLSAGNTLHTDLSGRLNIPAPPNLSFMPGGEVGKALAELQAELNAKFGSK